MLQQVTAQILIILEFSDFFILIILEFSDFFIRVKKLYFH